MFLNFINEQRVEQIIFALNGLTKCSNVANDIAKEIELKKQAHQNYDDCFKHNYENYMERVKYENILIKSLYSSKKSTLFDAICLKGVRFTQFKLDKMNNLIGIKSIEELLHDEQELLNVYPNQKNKIKRLYAYYLKDAIEILHMQSMKKGNPKDETYTKY
jgi:hypothetical protein